jgi:hypothetical protein
LEGLLDNKRSAAEIAELGHWSLAPKITQIVEALEGHRMNDHHRFMVRQALHHMLTQKGFAGRLSVNCQRLFRRTTRFARADWEDDCRLPDLPVRKTISVRALQFSRSIFVFPK